MKQKLEKKITLSVPEDTKSIIDGDALMRCFKSVIFNYKRNSDFREANCLERFMNALDLLPEIYLYKED